MPPPAARLPGGQGEHSHPCLRERIGADELDLGSLRPTGTRGLYVLGPMADVPRIVAAELANPAFGLRTRLMTEGGWDVSQLANSRERRWLAGIFQVSALDYLTARTFPDTIVQHRSRFDLHGAASHDFFYTKNIRTANHVTLEANGPYRALLPRRTNGLLVVGLGMSAPRDAMAIMRMQVDLQNQGYAINTRFYA